MDADEGEPFFSACWGCVRPAVAVPGEGTRWDHVLLQNYRPPLPTRLWRHFRCGRYHSRPGLRTVGDLLRKTAIDLYQVPGIGSWSVKLVRECLAENGLRLAGDG